MKYLESGDVQKLYDISRPALVYWRDTGKILTKPGRGRWLLYKIPETDEERLCASKKVFVMAGNGEVAYALKDVNMCLDKIEEGYSIERDMVYDENVWDSNVEAKMWSAANNGNVRDVILVKDITDYDKPGILYKWLEAAVGSGGYVWIMNREAMAFEKYTEIMDAAEENIRNKGSYYQTVKIERLGHDFRKTFKSPGITGDARYDGVRMILAGGTEGYCAMTDKIGLFEPVGLLGLNAEQRKQWDTFRNGFDVLVIPKKRKRQ